MNKEVIPIAIDNPSVKPDAIAAIEEAATFLPSIPYKGGRVVTAKGVGAVAKAIKKGFVRLAFFISGKKNDLGGSYDSKQTGPIILLPSDYKPGSVFYRSIAVHEAIHRAVDGAGYQGAFQISNFENEYLAHLGQACYAIQKKASLTTGLFKKILMAEAEPAARSLLQQKKVADGDRKKLSAAIEKLYDNYTIHCNGWNADDH